MSAVGECSFATSYIETCRQQRLRPLPAICVTLPHSLDFTTDRVKMDDWTPILNSLCQDRSLKSISVRSKYQHRGPLDQTNNNDGKEVKKTRGPVTLTRFLIEELTDSLARCARQSSALTSLELEGIPLPTECLAVLCLGLAANKSLERLSLRRCQIGDIGCELVCRALVEIQTLRWLSLAQCELTTAAGPALASALSRQKLALYHDAWKQSLRYREPKLDSMPGLRRLTLNGNPKLGDDAVTGIIDALRDSLWFKALDIQQCGLTERTANEILQLLEQNQTLVIVDTRLNPGIRDDSLREIARRLERNELNSKSCDYRWLSISNQQTTSQQQQQQQQVEASRRPAAARQRTSSAGNLHNKSKTADTGEVLPKAVATTAANVPTRPRSAVIRQVKKPPAPTLYRKPMLMPLPPMIRRMKTRSVNNQSTINRSGKQLPVKPTKPSATIKIPSNVTSDKTPKSAKFALHLDLQSQLKSISNSTLHSESVREEDEEEEESEEEEEITQRGSITASHTELKSGSSQEARRLRELLRELLETREERERLVENRRSLELALAEERARREFAESKLNETRGRIAELEAAAVKRERDTRGRLLVSRRSMDEICLSFARLLELLEESRSRRVTNGHDDDDSSPDSSVDSLMREDVIKRRFVHIIRKTKSENIRRSGSSASAAGNGNCLMMTTPKSPGPSARYGRSEADVRNAELPISARSTQKPENLRIDPHSAGDTGELPAALDQLLSASLRRYDDNNRTPRASNIGAGDNEIVVPNQRARTLFLSILQGDAVLGVNTRPR